MCTQTAHLSCILDVRLENETVWLTQAQMAELFQKERTVITRHINNVFKEGELEREVVCAKFAHTTQHGALKGKQQIKETILYNLDVIISVGYRVHSKRGTAFRIWARKIIKEYLVKGYAINDRIRKDQIAELRQLVKVAGRAINNQEVLETVESQDLLNVVVDYTYALDTLDNYDYERLTIDKTTKEERFHATYDNAMEEINRLREAKALEINAWLYQYASKDDQYVILDDEDYFFPNQQEHLILTDEKEGLTEQKAQKAICILNS